MISAAARLKQGETDKALAIFKQVAQANPKNIAARLNVAATFAAKKQYGEAVKQYEEVLKLAPDRIEALGGIAQVHMAQGTPKAAFMRVEEALKSSKNPAAIHQLLGQLSYSSRDYSKAIEYLEKAVGQNPQLTAAYYTIGNSYAAQKRFDAALDQYRTILKKNPKSIPAHMMIGTLHDQRGETAKANEAYQKVLDIDKNFAPAANNLAWNYAEHGGNIDIALTLAQKARELRANDPSIADTLGWIHFKKKSYGTAIALFKESSEKFNDKNPTVLYHLAQAQDKNGEEELARQSVKKALALNKDFAQQQDAKKLLASLGGK
jgi:tetratricopeptide (TPR) repeat protein